MSRRFTSWLLIFALVLQAALVAPVGAAVHADMNHADASAAAARTGPGDMNHGNMNHDNIDHGGMNRSQTDPGQMNHDQMSHHQMDHSQMDLGQTDNRMAHGHVDHGQVNDNCTGKTGCPCCPDTGSFGAGCASHCIAALAVLPGELSFTADLDAAYAPMMPRPLVTRFDIPPTPPPIA